MKKKKLNLATVEAAIENKAFTINEEDKADFICLILTSRTGEKKNCNLFKGGDDTRLSAAIAFKMTTNKDFRDTIYRSVKAYELVEALKTKEALSEAEKVINKLTGKLEKIFK